VERRRCHRVTSGWLSRVIYAVQRDTRAYRDDVTRTSRWVFPSETGETPLDARQFVNRVFLPVLEAAGIRNFHWHDLRHTFASRLAMAGVDLNTIPEIMGHKTLAMTLR
jgi:site-specific recombinase XerD